MKTKVLVSGKKKLTEITITSGIKPSIADEVVIKWQRLTDLLAQLFETEAAQIMRINHSNLDVFLAGRTKKSFFEEGSSMPLEKGLFCETVLGTNEMLHVYDATRSKKWQHIPDSGVKIKAYLGFPIRWPDGELFGTICVMEPEPNNFSHLHKNLLEHLRDDIEQDLAMLMKIEENEFLKGQLEEIMQELYQRVQQSFAKFEKYSSLSESSKIKVKKDS